MSESRRHIGFLGLGMMGLPMATRLLEAGHSVCGYDLSAVQAASFAAKGGAVSASPIEASRDAELLITMLPNAKVVAEAILGPMGALGGLRAGALVLEMSSSAPMKTRELGGELEKHGISIVDAPVSGGVLRAMNGTLSIMAGGKPADIERARPILSALGGSIFETGPLGSGHAMKALNNYVSASGLVAACEALVVGRAFGLSPETVVDILNASTGRNNSTETKLKQFVVSETFASGFAMSLMAKDLRTAAELADQLGVKALEIDQAADLWERAASASNGADHTAIYRFLADRKG